MAASSGVESHIKINTIPLRTSEKVLLAYFTYITYAAWIFPLADCQRLLLLGLNALVCATLISLGRFTTGHSGRSMRAFRDGLPAALILLAYRESGLLLFPDPTHHLDQIFVHLDHYVLDHPLTQTTLQWGSPWLQHYLEFSYLLCYPLVPLGAVVIYWHSLRQQQMAPPELREREHSRRLDGFWTTILIATLTCYALFPFFPLTPPRLLFHDMPGPRVGPWLRQVNFWLLDRYSVQACIFPSGHVAAATAVALAIRRHVKWSGYVFGLVAASIAAATVVGRYHYTADAIAGAIVGAAAYTVSLKLRSR